MEQERKLLIDRIAEATTRATVRDLDLIWRFVRSLTADRQGVSA